MSSTQLTYFARRLFQDMNLVGDLPLGFTSHSCKATILSWLSKASVRLEDRRLLGGHAKPGERVSLEYSRDALAGPLLTLERVVRAVSWESSAQTAPGQVVGRQVVVQRFGPHWRTLLFCERATLRQTGLWKVILMNPTRERLRGARRSQPTTPAVGSTQWKNALAKRRKPTSPNVFVTLTTLQPRQNTLCWKARPSRSVACFALADRCSSGVRWRT